jgi:hypothetical protein
VLWNVKLDRCVVLAVRLMLGLMISLLFSWIRTAQKETYFNAILEHKWNVLQARVFVMNLIV